MSIKSKTLVDFSLFALLALLWSGSFINIKIVVDVCPPFFSAMVRVLIAFILLTLFFGLQKKIKPVSFTIACRLWIAGIFAQAIPFAFLFYGEKFVEPALASIINSTVTIWVLLLGTVFFRHVSQWQIYKVIGCLLGFLGIILIFYPMITGESSDHHDTVIGLLSIMGMAISYAVGALINQHTIFGKINTSFETTIWQQHLASFVFLGILTLFFEPLPVLSSILPIKILGAFLYLGVFATFISWLIYFYLIREWGAIRTTSVMYIVPGLAFLWDYLFLQYIPDFNQFIGIASILIGVMLIQWMRHKPILT